MSGTAEKIASEASDKTNGPSSEERSANRVTSDNKMENDLEMNKDKKPSTDSADEVAGREGKGMAMADKLIGK